MWAAPISLNKMLYKKKHFYQWHYFMVHTHTYACILYVICILNMLYYVLRRSRQRFRSRTGPLRSPVWRAHINIRVVSGLRFAFLSSAGSARSLFWFLFFFVLIQQTLKSRRVLIGLVLIVIILLLLLLRVILNSVEDWPYFGYDLRVHVLQYHIQYIIYNIYYIEQNRSYKSLDKGLKWRVHRSSVGSFDSRRPVTQHETRLACACVFVCVLCVDRLLVFFLCMCPTVLKVLPRTTADHIILFHIFSNLIRPRVCCTPTTIGPQKSDLIFIYYDTKGS